MRLVPCLLAALSLCGQTVKVTVTVIDAVTQAPISGAVVRYAPAGGGKNIFAVKDQVTDATGSFTIDAPTPNRLWVAEIKAAGYTGHDPDTYVVTASAPVAVTYRLTRMGVISGRLVDADSGEPVPGVNVEPLLVTWARGGRELQRGFQSSVTQKDGSFSVVDLRVGDYVLDLNSFSANGKQRPVKGYPHMVWPGGGDFQSVAPVNLSYGADLRIGDVKLHSRDLAKLTVALSGGQCESGQRYDVALKQFSLSSSFVRGFLNVQCGDRATFDEVTPGDYEVQVDAPWQIEKERQSGAFAVQIGKGEEKATVILTPPMAIVGQVVMDREAPLPANLDIQLWARGSKLTGYLSHVHNFASTKVAADGSFRSLSYVPAGGEIEVNLGHLPAAYYVREIRYDGARNNGSVFVIHAGAAQQDLEVVLSNRAATLSRTVRTDDGKVLPGAKVLLTSWPADIVTDYPFGVAEVSADAPGSYAFAHLRPGTYRAIAVPAAVRAKFEEPGVMLSLFTSAESFELGETGSAVKNLAPGAPR